MLEVFDVPTVNQATGLELAKKLGLNEYESKAYLSLLEVGSASASSISSNASIPRARVYDVLVSLEKKGFVEKKPIKPVSYSAVLPSFVVKKIESVHRSGLEKSLKELVFLASQLEKRVVLSQKNIEQDDVVLLSGWNNIFSKISEKLAKVTMSVVFSTTSFENIKRKKELFSKQISLIESNGVKVVFRRSKSRYVLFDNKSVLLFLNPPSGLMENEKALFLENYFVASFFLKK